MRIPTNLYEKTSSHTCLPSSHGITRAHLRQILEESIH